MQSNQIKYHSYLIDLVRVGRGRLTAAKKIICLATIGLGKAETIVCGAHASGGARVAVVGELEAVLEQFNNVNLDLGVVGHIY